MFYVYILYAEKFDKFYVGQTNNLLQRLERHNAGKENFTAKYIPWCLLGFVEKQTRCEAVQLELKLKNLSKVKLGILVQKNRKKLQLHYQL
ncbi:MAG TPA: GIY-YIG nuclease family protein [Chitinophagaceae bacterium]|nr:GIY-YIG nuclease family protein [Chitinophagaceae bacterium]